MNQFNNFQQPFNNGFNNPYQYQQPYGQPQAQVKVNNILTPEEIDELTSKADQFTLTLTPTEQLKAWCTHIDKNGVRNLDYNNETGFAHCPICDSYFRPLEPDTSIDQLTDSIQRTLDIIQSIKCFAPDIIPVNAAKELFKIIPLLEKMPKLFTTSTEYAIKQDPNNQNQNYYYNQGMGTAAQFQNLAGLFAGAMAGPAFQNNFYNAQNPNPNAFGYAGSATPAGANPFGQPGGPAPMPQQQPYPQPNTGFQFNPDPNAVSQPVQASVQTPVPNQTAATQGVPAAPAATPETTVVKEEVKL